jgi:tetratricopeptide (TPR) repeat protein
LVVRILYLHESTANPTFDNPIVDAHAYAMRAGDLLSGSGLTDDFFLQPVFYPLFLSLVFLVSNSSILFAKLVQIVLGAFTCLLTYRLATKIFNRRVGLTAGFVTAFYGPLIFFETELVAAGWAAFWSVAMITLFLTAQRTKGLFICLAVGVCGALSIVTRPTFLPFVAAGCIWLGVVFSRGPGRFRAVAPRLAVVLAGLLVVLLPVSIQNHRLTGRFGFLPGSGGINLYIGNNPDPAETLAIRVGDAWTNLQRLPVRHGVTGIWNEQRYFYNQVGTYLRSDPLSFAGGIARKTGQFVSSREIPRSIDIYLYREWSTLLSVLTWKVGPWGFPFGLILPFAIAGLILRRRAIPKPLYLYVILFPLSIILVFVSARYRVAVIPPLAVVAAAGFWAVIDGLRSWSRAYKAAAVAIMGGIVLVSTLPDPFGQESGNYKAEMYYAVGCTKQDAGREREATIDFERAIQLYPDYAEAHVNLANILTNMARWNDAISHYRRAIAVKPDFATAHYSYGVALARTGKTDEAMRRFEETLRIMPDHGAAHHNLGVALHLTGNNNEAARHLREAIELVPEPAEAHYFLGIILASQGDYPRAIAEYRVAVDERPDWPDALNKLALLLATCEKTELRNPAAAIKLAERACQLTGYRAPYLLETLAVAYSAAGGHDLARQTAMRAAKLAQDHGRDDVSSRIRSRFQLDETVE